MKTEIFRKVSLERLSSPEQLDQLMRVSSAKAWTALLSVLVLLGMAVAWGFKGSITTTAPGQGVIVRLGGVLNVVSTGSGVVTSLNAKVGGRIGKNQVIAQIAQPALAERIRAIPEAIDEARLQRSAANQVRTGSTRLQLNALNQQRENAQREIKVLQDEAKLVAEQVPVEAELLSKGLITRQHTFAAKQTEELRKYRRVPGVTVPPEGFLNYGEAAAVLGVAAPVIRGLVAQGIVHAAAEYRFGLSKQLTAADVQRFAERYVATSVLAGRSHLNSGSLVRHLKKLGTPLLAVPIPNAGKEHAFFLRNEVAAQIQLPSRRMLREEAERRIKDARKKKWAEYRRARESALGKPMRQVRANCQLSGDCKK